jgi:CheY-like chemotaxis protein
VSKGYNQYHFRLLYNCGLPLRPPAIGPRCVNPRMRYLLVSTSSSGADLMLNKSKILLAEDEPSLSRYIEMLFSQWDCDIVVEQTAERAIRRAATFKPDIALLGFITPGMDGVKAGIELLKDSPETRIVLTVESVPSKVLDALRAQGYDFRTLVAPFNIEELQSLCFPPSQPKVG